MLSNLLSVSSHVRKIMPSRGRGCFENGDKKKWQSEGSFFGFLAAQLLGMQEWLDQGAPPAAPGCLEGGVAAPDGLLVVRAGS